LASQHDVFCSCLCTLTPHTLEAGYSRIQAAAAGYTVIIQTLLASTTYCIILTTMMWASNKPSVSQENIDNTTKDYVASPYHIHATT